MLNMNLKFLSVSVFLCFEFIFSSPQESVWVQLQRDQDLKTFLGHLEKFEKTTNEVVFVLDESGSIELENFPLVLNFTELTARQLSVSPEDSRVAAITFDDEVRTHLDFITQPHGNNMCTFLSDLSKIKYSGGATHTGDAMLKAESILKKGTRPSANKLIILLTDGKSKGGADLASVVTKLKASNVTIFVVGVANIDMNELEMVATSNEHLYVVKDFAFVVSLNQYLINDTKEVSYDNVSKGICDSFCAGGDCCDKQADCFCGTKSGKYECACTMGFQGTSGYKGQCIPCPLGTYKEKIGNLRCHQCPANSTTAKVGCTSVADCLCVPGHVGDVKKNKPCSPIQCNALKPPLNGVLIPRNCGNTYGSDCQFKCNEGYCPYSCSGKHFAVGEEPWHFVPPVPRRCLGTSIWSGQDFLCEKMTCPPLQFPKSGNHNCSTQNTDFSFGTRCDMSCRNGSILKGSKSRICLLNGSWSGNNTICESITCKPLKTNGHLYVKPKECGQYNMSYDSVCQYYCAPGFRLDTNYKKSNNSTILGLRRCEVYGYWSNSGEPIICKDIQPPTITCPPSKTQSTDFGFATAKVSWNFPVVSDNVYANSPKIIAPFDIQKPPYDFHVGSTKVVYMTSDQSNHSNTCSFTVTVIDVEPPKVNFCPNDIVQKHSKKSEVVVKWETPRFSDNSGLLMVTSNRKSGEIFTWGKKSTVTYEARDSSGNEAKCSFSVSVIPHSCEARDPPVNGFLTCDKWTNGQLCRVTCQEGFNFNHNFDRLYFCSQTTKRWQRVPGQRNVTQKFVYPWPDCSARSSPKSHNYSMSANFTVESCSEEKLAKQRATFIQILKEKYKRFCPEHKGCNVLNVKITCGKKKKNNGNNSLEKPVHNNKLTLSDQGYSSVLDFGTRHRRSLEDENGEEIHVTFYVEVPNVIHQPGRMCDEDCEDVNMDDNNDSFPSYENILKNITNEAIGKIHIRGGVQYNSISIYAKPVCLPGSRLVNDTTCVNCPIGTYMTDSMSYCKHCPFDKYQDLEGKVDCKVCPPGTHTSRMGAKELVDCKGPCKPGTFSASGFEPCKACPNGTFADEIQSKTCTLCPDYHITTFTGAYSSINCVAPCPIGTYSKNGFQPCTMCPFGHYQPFTQRPNCLRCMKGTTTIIEGATDSKYCHTIHFCKDFKPCLNGATCLDTRSSFKCQCRSGFIGAHCDINQDDCTPNLCENNSTCIDGLNQFTCHCRPGFSGSKCEFEIDECESNPCQNDGTCNNFSNGYNCTCSLGFGGQNCEINFDDCISTPCLNNGVCFDKANGYKCHCPAGYTGNECAAETDMCTDSPCLNSGTCETLFNAYICKCAMGFDGMKCENNSDDCLPSPCLNGGTCIDGDHNVTCICPISYSGAFCETGFEEFALNFSKGLTSEYVIIPNYQYLTEITVSFFMKKDHVDLTKRETPISYSYVKPDKSIVDNGFTLLDTNSFKLYIGNQEVYTGYAVNSDSKWHHYAVTWESFNKLSAFYVDGEAKFRGEVSNAEYLYPGVFVLGQEQDEIGGGFNSIESFVGEISEFNVWNYTLLPEEISELSKSCGYTGNLISWLSVSKYIDEHVETSKNFKLCSEIGICSSSRCNCKKSEENPRKCSQNINSCYPNPCMNNQTCFTSEGIMTCNCDDGYSGRYCQYDKNECLIENGGCSHICNNTFGTYTCYCPENMNLLEDGRTCIETEFCKMAGKVYFNGENWEYSCKSFSCINGVVTSTGHSICPNVSCGKEEIKVLLPQQCCETCLLATPCTSYGGIIETFDNMVFEMEGKCKYRLIEDRLDATLAIHVDMDIDKTWRMVTIYDYSSKIVIASSGLVTLNDVPVSLPLKGDILIHLLNGSNKHSTANDSLDVDTTNGTFEYPLQSVTRQGIVMELLDSDKIVVKVTEKNKNKVSGLCGNFNGNPKDDMLTTTNEPVNKIVHFIKNWTMSGECRANVVKELSLKGKQREVSARKVKHITRKQKWTTLSCISNSSAAESACSAIWSDSFRPCHGVIKPIPYFILCLKTACTCKHNTLCFCNALLAYVTECANHDVVIENLGAASACRSFCSDGMVYRECSEMCPQTCNLQSTEQCLKWYCSPRCACPENSVLRNGKCVEKKKC